MPVHYIAQVRDHLQESKIDSAHWLAHFGLGDATLLQPNAVIDYKQYEQLILAAAKLSKQPDIGLAIGARLSITSHGVLGFTLLNCGSLRQAIEVCQRYVGIRTPLLEVELNEENRRAALVVHERVNIDNIQSILIESLLVSLKQSLSFVVGQNRIFHQVELNYPPPSYYQKYQAILACPTSFGHQKCRIEIDSELLDVPLPGRDEHSFSQAEALCKIELEKIKMNRQVAGQVYTLLMLSNPEHRSLATIAAKLFITPRTLHRHLVAQGNHFNNILQQVKSDQAKTMLKQGKSVKTVAYALGYNDSANFRRAFKRWESITPQTYIAQIRSL